MRQQGSRTVKEIEIMELERKRREKEIYELCIYTHKLLHTTYICP